MERRIEELLEIAHRIVEEGRSPTDDERRRFRKLEAEIETQPVEWRERFGGLIDRLASALEGLGI